MLGGFGWSRKESGFALVLEPELSPLMLTMVD